MITKERYLYKNVGVEAMLCCYILLYFAINLMTLTDFPFVHSDEAWLSGLARNMLESRSLGVTETFFDLKPRYPHAIKSLFHLLQMPMLLLFGYRIFSFRLLSLIFGCLSLLVFYMLMRYLTGNEDGASKLYPLLATIALSLDIQFIYAAHFARQEILLIFSMLLCLYGLAKKSYTMAAVATGLSIGLHPNSFLLGTMCLLILLPFGESGPKKSWKPVIRYSAITGAFALAFIGLSLSFDRNFFSHYLAYGSSEFHIGASPANKLAELPYFIKKIWYGVSGTYYVPNIRFQLILFAVVLGLAFLYRLMGKEENRSAILMLLKGIVGLALGMVIIGRYNQTGIIFFFPLCYLLLFILAEEALDSFRARSKGRFSGRLVPLILSMALSVTLGGFSVGSIKPWLQYSYGNYLGEIAKAVEPDHRVLANLNSEYYFENGKLFDVRNLSYLKEKGMTIEDYIKENQIEYILLSDEMDFIYSQRPIWNILYGNPRYMEELRAFVEADCVLVHQFEDNAYAIRIPRYMNSDRDFTIGIYRVKEGH